MNLTEFFISEKLNKNNLFGEFIKQRRMELGITIREMALHLTISFGYLCDIEQGKRLVPIKLIKDMSRVLQIPENEMVEFEDLAYQSHETCAPDIIKYLLNNSEARKKIRNMIKQTSDLEQ